MQILEVETRNVGRLGDRKFVFGPGVNGIVGANGTGKSTLMKTIQFLITGDWPGYGTKNDQITVGQDSGESTMKFLDNGVVGVVSRTLHSSATSLVYGDEKLRGRDSVDKRMAQILGAESRVLERYVFVRQGQTSQVLLGKTSDRIKSFSVLFGTDHCENLREIIGRQLQAHIPLTLMSTGDEINARIAEAGRQRQALSSENSVLSQKWASFDVEASRQKTATAAMNADRTKRLPDLEKDLGALIKDDKPDSDKLLSLQGGLREVVSLLEVGKADYERARNVVREKKSAEEADRKHKDAAAQLSRVRKELEEKTAPEVEPDNDAVMDLFEHADLTPKEAQVADYKRFIQAFNSGKCPTCGTHSVTDAAGNHIDLQARFTEVNNALHDLEPWCVEERKKLNGYLERRRKTQQAYAVWKTWSDQVSLRVSQAEAALANHPAVSVVDSGDAQLFVSDYEQGLSMKTAYETEINGLVRKRAAAEARIPVIQEQIKELRSLVVEDVSALLSRIKAYEVDSRRSIEITTLLNELNKTDADLAKQKSDYEQAKAKGAAVTKYRSLLSAAQGVLHRDNYPSAVARTFFSKLNGEWNNMLRVLDVPFSVRLAPETDDLRIMCTFPEGDFVIDQISGGQICCASISFLMAVNRLFASQIGLLVLDEPTYGPDEEHVERIRELLTTAQRYSADTGLQILVVTHEKRLREGFNHLVEIG